MERGQGVQRRGDIAGTGWLSLEGLAQNVGLGTWLAEFPALLEHCPQRWLTMLRLLVPVIWLMPNICSWAEDASVTSPPSFKHWVLSRLWTSWSCKHCSRLATLHLCSWGNRVFCVPRPCPMAGGELSKSGYGFLHALPRSCSLIILLHVLTSSW